MIMKRSIITFLQPLHISSPFPNVSGNVEMMTPYEKIVYTLLQGKYDT